ncbi:MAG: ABC transporter substrate-binding protein [Actinobacteria bacterium]|nr:ABC transporter substrate-binding protein [Actinomycetota bacterium]
MSSSKSVLRSALAATGLVAAALLVAGCGATAETAPTGPAQKGGTLNLAPEAEVLSFVPGRAIQRPEINILAQVLQGLFVFDSEDRIRPLLVSSYKKSPDLTEWTFHLRPDVKFSDGKPLTPADVVFSIEAAEKSVTWGTLYEQITSVTAKGPSTVVIKTDSPAPTLPAVLALFPAGIMPKDFGGKTEAQFGQQPMGTGPFQVTSWKHGSSITLERNPYYWKKGLPLLEKVVYFPSPNDNSRVSQLKAEQLEIISKPPVALLNQLEVTPGLSLVFAEDNEMGTLLLNARKPLFKDPRGREAVNLALNRDEITQAAFKGYGRPGASFFPPTMLYAKHIKPPVQDAAKAKALLAEAVAASGESPDIELTIEVGEENANAAAQVIQQELQAVGFTVTIKPLEAGTLYEQDEAGEFDTSLTNFYSLLHDPVEQAGFYPSTDGFWTGAADSKEIGALVAKAAQEVDPRERERLYHEIQQLVFERNDLIVLFYAPATSVASTKVSGFKVNSVDLYNLEEVGFAK